MATRFDQYDNSLVLDGFENGIADSPYSGIADMRNVDITTVPGEASVAFATSALSVPPTVTTVNFTATASTDLISVSSTTGYYNGMAITLNTLSGGTGLSAGRVYWIGNLSGTTFKLYKSPGIVAATPVDITVDGSGTLSSYTMGQPKYWTNDLTAVSGVGLSFMVDANGRVWWANNYLTVAGGPAVSMSYLGNTTLTNATGNGLAAYQGYIFVMRFDAVDYVKVANLIDSSDATASWVYGWKTITASSTNHFAYVATDNKLYWCGQNTLSSLYPNVAGSFDPTTSSTYTYNDSTALVLPRYEQAICIGELGTSLLVGGIFNKLYPWDKLATTYLAPIWIADQVITRIVTVNTNAYIFAGLRGRIYITNGSQAQLYKKIPDHISGTVEPYFTWGDAIFNRNNIVFGVKATDNAGNAINQYGGLWAIDVDTNALRMLNKLSYATYAGYATALSIAYVVLSSGNPAGFGLYIGWDSGASTYGVDTGTSSPYTGGQATIDFDLIPIGTYQRPRNLEQLEYKLSRPLVSGESITINQRLIFNTSDTGYTQIVSDSTVGSYSGTKALNFKNAQWLQLQAVLTSTASSPSYVRLKEIRITGIKSTYSPGQAAY